MLLAILSGAVSYPVCAYEASEKRLGRGIGVCAVPRGCLSSHKSYSVSIPCNLVK